MSTTTRRTPTERPVAPATVQGTVVPPVDPFDQLLSAAAASDEPIQGEVRPIVKMDQPLLETFRNWADGKYVSGLYGDYTKANADALEEVCLKTWIEALWTHKIRPANPELQDVDGAGKVIVSSIVVVKDDYDMNLPKSKDDPRTVATDALAEQFVKLCGQTPSQARTAAADLVAECLSYETVLSPVDLTPYPEDKEPLAAAKRKLVRLMLWDGVGDRPEPLNEADRKFLLKKKMVLKVKSGFIDRLVAWAKSRDQMMAVFAVFQPKTAMNAPKWDSAARDGARIARLVATAKTAIETRS